MTITDAGLRKKIKEHLEWCTLQQKKFYAAENEEINQKKLASKASNELNEAWDKLCEFMNELYPNQDGEFVIQLNSREYFIITKENKFISKKPITVISYTGHESTKGEVK